MKKKMSKTKKIILGLIGLTVLGVGIFVFVDDIYPELQRNKYHSILKKGHPFSESDINYILKFEKLRPEDKDAALPRCFITRRAGKKEKNPQL